MDFKEIISRIDNYLHSDKGYPIIVDVQNKNDMGALIEHYSTDANDMIHVSKYCIQDGVFKIDEFKNELPEFKRNTFISGLSAFLKLEGESAVKSELKKIVSTAIKAHVVVFTYQCRNYLKFSDPRIAESGKILVLDGTPDTTPSIVFIPKSLTGAFSGCYTGFNTFPRVIEGFDGDTAYIATEVDKDVFPDSIIRISQLRNGYDIICSRDSKIRTVPQSFGSSKQWNSLLEKMGRSDKIDSVVDMLFGSTYNLGNAIKDYCSFDDTKKWIYFICLCIFGVKGNEYLKRVLSSISSNDELVRAIFREIIKIDHNSKEFELLYNERKIILSGFTDKIDEFIDFCKFVSQKGIDAIYYLTDLTQIEKEKIINYLDTYGASFKKDELVAILEKIYPDLAKYLNTFRFKNDLLDSYFESYKYQKVINKILPEFEQIVDEQATKHDFVSLLKPRSTVANKIDVDGAQAYFVDAMGAEYIGFIVAKCNALGLSANVTTCRAELPTLTEFNKDFVSVFESKGCSVSDIKDLDEIKHHGKDDYDYEKIKTPIYLIKELAIIDDLIKRIKANISNGIYSKGIIISDHGASRLAVLHETENIWSMETKGIHSGRCCPRNEINEKPDSAIQADDYWVLSNYDRFKGSRKANVEVHGGASLEEVTVPIIEITVKRSNIEAFITDDCKVLTIGPDDIVNIVLYVGIKSNNVGIEMNGKYYDAVQTADGFTYTVTLPNLPKGIYNFDILIGNDIVAKNQKFEIKKKGMSVVDLF